MPLSWKQVEAGVKITDFTITNAAELLKAKGDPWADFFAERQTLKFD
jgi:DNA primase